MAPDRQEVTWYYSTMLELFRDLHVAAVMTRDKREGKLYVPRYVDTLVLIWETLTGQPMTTAEALHILCADFTDKEKENAREIPKRKAD